MKSQTAPVSAERAKQLNPVVLAFVGDAVYSLYVRERLVLSGMCKPAELNKLASAVVSAHGQSGDVERLLPLFTEEEAEIYRRGRNAKKPSKSKNASVCDYARSTGFEAVAGYLYLTGRTERLQELFFPEEERGE